MQSHTYLSSFQGFRHIHEYSIFHHLLVCWLTSVTHWMGGVRAFMARRKQDQPQLAAWKCKASYIHSIERRYATLEEVGGMRQQSLTWRSARARPCFSTPAELQDAVSRGVSHIVVTAHLNMMSTNPSDEYDSEKGFLLNIGQGLSSGYTRSIRVRKSARPFVGQTPPCGDAMHFQFALR